MNDTVVCVSHRQQYNYEKNIRIYDRRDRGCCRRSIDIAKKDQGNKQRPRERDGYDILLLSRPDK